MPIISTIGRRSPKTKALVFVIYFILLAGSITMLYPFLLMVAGTSKSSVDTPESKLIPDYLKDETALYRKTLESFFNEQLNLAQMAFKTPDASFRYMNLPEKPNKKIADEWGNFLAEAKLPFYFYSLGYSFCEMSRNTIPFKLREFKDQLFKEYKGDLNALNKKQWTEFTQWAYFTPPREVYLARFNAIYVYPFLSRFIEFKEKQPQVYRFYFSPEGYYVSSYLMVQYSKNIAEYNKTHGTDYRSWDDVYLTRRYPAGPSYTDKERLDWEAFTRGISHLQWLRADEGARPLYQEFLKAKYEKIEALNKNYQTSYVSFDEIPLVLEPPFEGIVLSDWSAFVQGWKEPSTGKMFMLPNEMIIVHSVEFLFRDWLEKKYGSISAFNSAFGKDCKNWIEIYPPQKEYHYFWFVENENFLKWNFSTRNIVAVTEFITLQGRALFNTALYCALAILTALIFNPLAAYALSRFKPPSTYKVLLFLMLTMAFPPIVTQIPIFLMLREFNLLNTFAALILPGLANGYSIFLLKGFFDSLPRELYESAEIDGAGEFTIFFHFTMRLSTPILAVIALGTFTGAYGNFMMALLICQDQTMWTLMPWLFQLQQSSCQGIVFSSLIIAAIPTFLIFAFCQNVIMRGIVVPVEK